MNSGTTTERVYEALRQALQRRGMRPGARLDPAVLAVELGSSVTPVRDALHILVGEGLVGSRHGIGFHVPDIDAPCLADLYAWNLGVLALAIREWDASRPMRRASAAGGNIAERTSELFLAIARRSANAMHSREMSRMNARLHPARLAEESVLAELETELTPIGDALTAGQPALLRRHLGAYHRRRIKAAAAIVRKLYRAGGEPEAS